MNLVVYCFAVFGACYIVGMAKISLPIRVAWASLGTLWPPLLWALALVECPMCLGTWIGMVVGALGLFGWDAGLVGLAWWQRALVVGSFTCGINYVLAGLGAHSEES